MPFSRLFSKESKYAEIRQEDDQQHQKKNEPASTRGILLYLSLALLNIALGGLIGYWYSSKTINSTKASGSQATVLSQISLAQHAVPFSPDPKYMGPSPAVNKNWALLTQSTDSIYLPNPSEYNLSDPGIRAPFFIFNDPPPSALNLANVRNFYVLSNLHQLHCTNMIRKRYNALVYDPSAAPLSDTEIDKDWITHLEHCFEYLRLSITCGDNMVFESDSPPGSPEEFWKDGLSWGVVHSCMDWEALMRWQEDQLVLYNSTWS